MSIYDSLGLPPSITDLVEMAPVEDLILAILREKLPDLPCVSLLPMNTDSMDFFALVRRAPYSGTWTGDPRFIDHANLSVNVFTRDPNADAKAAVISEAVRVTLRDAAREQKVYPDLGWLKEAGLSTEPARQPDWASSTGPVQYADLPAGFFRYQATYTLTIRRPT